MATNVTPLNKALRAFRYHILPANCPPGFEKLELHNQAFTQWRKTWTEVMEQIAGHHVRLDDFWRQRLVCVVSKGDEIAAVHLYSFFNLESHAATAHSYMRAYYKDADIEKMRANGIQSVMSMEYLTVSPEFRNSAIGFPVVSLLMGLGGKVFEHSGYDAAVAPCRTDLKVDVRATEFGGQPISEPYVYTNFPVINMALRRGQLRAHPDPTVNAAIDDLWARREDHSGFPFVNPAEPIKKTA